MEPEPEAVWLDLEAYRLSQPTHQKNLYRPNRQ